MVTLDSVLEDYGKELQDKCQKAWKLGYLKSAFETAYAVHKQSLKRQGFRVLCLVDFENPNKKLIRDLKKRLKDIFGVEPEYRVNMAGVIELEILSGCFSEYELL